MKRACPKKPAGGFTLVELLVVITIIAILAGIALPVFTSVQERARITQDLSNLRQLGIATQTYLNDNESVLFSSDQASNPWMKALHPKYLSVWKICESPFDDKRTPVENDTSAPVSYGLNGNSVAGLSVDKIARPSAFILLAPAQGSGSTVNFSGTSGSAVTVFRAKSTPGGTATGGTHNGRQRINALFADLHSENLTWAVFIQNAAGGTSTDDSNYRWDPAP
jgi:prepilin-type N-terminal cleavage/methylation domain-containing protein/prepilin-type processing-associated H-X9-DG protein